MGLYRLFTLLFFCGSLCAKEVIYLDGSTKDGFAYQEGLSYHELNIWQKIAYMLSKYDVNIHSQDNIHIDHLTKARLHQMYGDHCQLFFIDYRGHHPLVPQMKKVPKEGLMNILFEPPSVFHSYDERYYSLFSKVFTFHDGLVDGKKFIKFRYAPLAPMRKDLPPFNERKLCCGFYGNKRSDYPGELYSERRRAIAFFEKYHPEDFEFYGPGWDGKGFKTYRGAVENKYEVMKGYKFAIAYENTKDVPGYVTEKIFDCFQAGVVPVYWGSPTITDEIPADCFIDFRKFSSYEELYRYMISMGEGEFNTYLDNIRRFLSSEEAKVFDQDHFVLSIVNGILGTELTVSDLI